MHAYILLPQPTTKYRVQPAFFYQQNEKQLNITFAINESVRDEIGYGNASTLIAIEEPLIGVSNKYPTIS